MSEIRESETVEFFSEFIFIAHRSYISLSNLGTHKAEEKNQIMLSHHPFLMELLWKCERQKSKRLAENFASTAEISRRLADFSTRRSRFFDVLFRVLQSFNYFTEQREPIDLMCVRRCKMISEHSWFRINAPSGIVKFSDKKATNGSAGCANHRILCIGLKLSLWKNGKICFII